MTQINNTTGPVNTQKLELKEKEEKEEKKTSLFPSGTDSLGKKQEVSSPFDIARSGISAAEKLIQSGIPANKVSEILESPQGERIVKAITEKGARVVCNHKTDCKRTIDKAALASAFEGVNDDSSEILKALYAAHLQSSKASREIDLIFTLMTFATSNPIGVASSLKSTIGSLQSPEAKALAGSCLQQVVSFAHDTILQDAKKGNTDSARHLMDALSGPIQTACGGECHEFPHQHIENLSSAMVNTTEVTTQSFHLEDIHGNLISDEFGELSFEHTSCEESIECEVTSEALEYTNEEVQGTEAFGSARRIADAKKAKDTKQSDKQNDIKELDDKERLASAEATKNTFATKKSSTAKSLGSA